MTSNFELKGEWYLPSDKDKRVNGSLIFESNDGANLELFGNFDDAPFFPELREDDFILGLTNDSKLITLYKCFMTRSGGATLVKGQESGMPSSIYTVNYVLIGAHIENEDDLKFNKISCEIFNLDEWVGISGFAHKPTDFEKLKNHEITIDFKLPEPIDFNIDRGCKGKINFVSNHPGWSRYQKSVSINQRVEFQVDSTDEKSIKDMLSYVFRFQNFLILALYRSTYSTSIYLSLIHI